MLRRRERKEDHERSARENLLLFRSTSQIQKVEEPPTAVPRAKQQGTLPKMF